MVELLGRIDIRSAGPDDLDILAVLGSEILAVHAAGRPDLFREPDAAALRAFFAERLADDAHILVAVLNGHVVGYVYAEHRVRETTPFTTASSLLYIEHIAVTAESRGSGIGGQLIDAALSVAARFDATAVRLDSWTFNHAAHEFFASHGFTPLSASFERDLRNSVGKLPVTKK